MRRIFKYVLGGLAVCGNQVDITLPSGAEVLSAGFQGGKLVVWAKVVDSAPQVTRRFMVCLTDGCPPQTGKFLGTLILENGDFILHVWDMGEIQ